MSVTIFFCYAHEDEALLNKLKSHLRPLQRQGLIAVWHDRDISAGTEWEQEIKQHLNAAQIILLLISPDFMNSDYCYGIEMQRALERHQRGEARVIPIILRFVHWQGILGNLQALPTDAKPVNSWSEVDEAFFDVAEGIRKVVVQLGLKAVSPSEVLPSQASKGESADISPTALSPPPAKPLPSLKPKALSLLRTLFGHTSYVTSVAFSPDGLTLASGSHDQTIKLWDVASGKKLRTLKGHKNAVTSVAFSPDGLTLASGSYDQKIKLWNLASGEALRTLKGHTSAVWSVAFHPDGQTVAGSGGYDNTIKLWNGATGQEVRTLTGHTSYVTSVAFSPDGLTLASGSHDQTIKLWDVAIGQEVRTLTGHTGWVSSVVFSPDGLTLASGGDNTIKLWNLASGEALHPPTKHTSDVLSVAFSPDGLTLASGSNDGTIKIWGKKRMNR